VRIAQVENPGGANETGKNAGPMTMGSCGKMENVVADRAAGWAECMCRAKWPSLTRSIPTGLGWMVGPFVTSIPKESLTFTLGGYGGRRFWRERSIRFVPDGEHSKAVVPVSAQGQRHRREFLEWKPRPRSD